MLINDVGTIRREVEKRVVQFLPAAGSTGNPAPRQEPLDDSGASEKPDCEQCPDCPDCPDQYLEYPL